MGFLDIFKFRKTNKEMYRANAMKTTYPSFSQFGENIMNDDTVLTIVNRILDEFSKLNPRHIRTVEGKQVKVTDNTINALLQFPNNLMTRTDFLRKIRYLYETYDNAFIYPTYDLYQNKTTGLLKKVYTGLYPLQPTNVDFFQDDSGTYYIEFTFQNGEKSGPILYDDIIHWRKEFGENEFMGGNLNGVPNNTALLNHLRLNHNLLESTFKTIEGSLAINGVLKYGGLIDEDKREEARLKFEESLKSNKSGVIALDSGGDYIPISTNIKTIDKDTLEFFNKKILQHYGVSEAILNGDYTNEQKEAFYESCIEAGVISLGLAFERVLLTPFERSNGNKIIFYTNRIQMMSADKKIKLAEVLLPVRGTTPNEIRSWFGEAPIDGGDQTYLFLNWVPGDIAEEYQLEKYKNENNVSNSENDKQDETQNDKIEVGDTDEE